MKTIALSEIAEARSGDKGDGSNVGVFARDPRHYEFLRRWLTPERVKAHLREICLGQVVRYEAPNLFALNFLLGDSLGGGGSASLKTDAQGKTHGLALLQMQIPAAEVL